MYLKSLEVHGFKSFANKMLFEFHDGITAIVGPNGSGKSNVADAVRWVLGEQSAKQLRGARMEDVIFAGTETRKPQGFAYVAITISNDDHKLNVPYEEVKIARRVYRSGESEYLLNGAACRLKDIQELLFDTGIGKEGYSIIGQGQIDKILSGKPEERRELFDEAAGIVKYKKRKYTAEKNLEEEKQNLVRIEDILSELEKQVGPLERQSEKAREYLKYRDELKALDVNMFLAEYDRNHASINEIDNKRSIADSDLKNAQAELEKSRAEFEKLESEIADNDRILEEHREAHAAAKIDLNRYESDIRLMDEQINSIRQSESHYKEQKESFEKRLKELQNEACEYDEQLKDNQAEIEKLNGSRSEIDSVSGEITRRIAQLEAEINKCQADKLAVMDEAVNIKTDEQKFLSLIEQNNLERAKINSRILENKSQGSNLSEIMVNEKQILDGVSEKLSELNRMELEIDASIKKISGENENIEREYRDTQSNFHMENSRLNSLKNMTERYEGFGQSIKRVMEKKSEMPGIIGVVADIIRVKKEYETAVETALGGSIQNIVTDNEQTAKSMINYLKKNRYGRATFLPLTNIKGRQVNNSANILSETGVIGMASSLAEADDRFSSLVEYLLGRFVVVDNIDNAIALAKKYHHTLRIVTVEGELLNPGGSMSGGAFKNSNNLLGRRREMEDLEKRTDMLKKRLKEISGELSSNQAELADLRQNKADNQKIRQELGIKQNTAKINYERAEADFEKCQEQLEHIHLDAREIEQKKTNLKRQLDEINLRLAENEEKNKAFDIRQQEYSGQLEDLRKKEAKHQESNSQIAVNLAAAQQSSVSINENISRVQENIKDVREQLAENDRNSKNIDNDIQDKLNEIERVKKLINETAEKIEALRGKIDNEMTAREELSGKNKGFIERREQLSEQTNSLKMECMRLDNQKEKLVEKTDSYINYMWEEYELTYHSAEELKKDTGLSEQETKKRIAELKNTIKGLGDININAIEQYREISERYELLKTQHEDLIKSADVLVGVIEELDAEMRKQFEAQFAEIKVRFDRVFKELFGGGHGRLELVDDEDVLTAGISIIAQPPGKKLQNMMQLSGGEKALTAIALLFAIQSLKPSPFCLLDEIEAALDDSNVGRYADYLHKLTRDTQFIVITHRRGTMNAADILYGITMQEKGVSTLVSVNLLDVD